MTRKSESKRFTRIKSRIRAGRGSDADKAEYLATAKKLFEERLNGRTSENKALNAIYAEMNKATAYRWLEKEKAETSVAALGLGIGVPELDGAFVEDLLAYSFRLSELVRIALCKTSRPLAYNASVRVGDSVRTLTLKSGIVTIRVCDDTGDDQEPEYEMVVGDDIRSMTSGQIIALVRAGMRVDECWRAAKIRGWTPAEMASVFEFDKKQQTEVK